MKTLLEPSLKALFIGRSESAADNGAVFTSALPPLSRSLQRQRAARRVAAALALLTAACLLPAQAKERERESGDHDRARSAVESGAVLPLPALLEKLQRTHPGRVLELELERDDGQWIYEVKLLHANGQLLKIKLDAATGALLQVKQRRAEKTPDPSGETSRERSKAPLTHPTPQTAPPKPP